MSQNSINQMIITPFFLDDPLPQLEKLATADWIINKPNLPDGDKQHRMSGIHRTLADHTRQSILDGKRPISIAGDCCTPIGVLAGLQRAGIDPILIWFDAHGDLNTWETTPSGFLGGMPLAMLIGRGEQTMLKALELRPLPEDQVVLTDARDLDPGEKQLIKKANINHLSDVNDLLGFKLPDAPIYIHLDMDIINPNEAPAMNYLAAGGPSVKELQNVMKHLKLTGEIAAVSASTWNPKMDQDGQSRNNCMKVLNTLIDECWQLEQFFAQKEKLSNKKREPVDAGAQLLIQPQTGTALTVPKGQIIRVIDVEGQQVADLVCFARQDTQEYLSSGRSIDYNAKLFLTTGDILYSNRSNAMLSIGQDPVGKHDFLFAPCSQEMFELTYQVAGPHPNCLDNLAVSLRTYGIQYFQIPTAFNIFMNVEVTAAGQVTVQPPLSKPGDYIDLHSEMDLIVGISACSAGECNNFRCTPIRVEIYPA